MLFIAATAIGECGQPIGTHPYGVRIGALEEIGGEGGESPFRGTSLADGR